MFFKTELSQLKHTNIKEISSLSKLDLGNEQILMKLGLENISRNTFIGFDIDCTLIHRTDVMDDKHAIQRKRLIERLKQEGARGAELVEIAFTQSKFSLVENEILDLIKGLQEFDALTVFAFTARRTGKPQVETKISTEEETVSTLAKLGIDFSKAFQNYPGTLGVSTEYLVPIQNSTFISYAESHGPLLRNGVLFSAGYEKKGILEWFLNLDKKPDCLVFFDDNLVNLQGIEQVCNDFDIEFKGFHYTAAYANGKNNIKPEIVEYQFQHLVNHNQWINHREAEIICAQTNQAAIGTETYPQYFV